MNSLDTHREREETPCVTCVCVCVDSLLDRDTRRRMCKSSRFPFVKIESQFDAIVSIASGGVCLSEFRQSRILPPRVFFFFFIAHTFNIVTRCRIHVPRPGEYPANRHTHPGVSVTSRISWASRSRSPYATRYPIIVCYYSCITRYRRAHTSCRSRDRWCKNCVRDAELFDLARIGEARWKATKDCRLYIKIAF